MNYLGIISAVSEHNRHLSKEPTLNCSFRYFATSSLPQENMIRSPFFSWIFKNTNDWAGKVEDEQQEKKTLQQMESMSNSCPEERNCKTSGKDLTQNLRDEQGEKADMPITQELHWESVIAGVLY